MLVNIERFTSYKSATFIEMNKIYKDLVVTCKIGIETRVLETDPLTQLYDLYFLV